MKQQIMIQLQAFPELIFKENPELSDLGLIIAVLAVFWGAVFGITIPILSNYFKKQPWFHQVSDSDYERDWKELQKIIGVQESKEEYYNRFAYDCPYWICVSFQHLIGGALCLPAILGIFEDPSVGTSLVSLGIMCELAYEVSDTMMQLHRRYCTPHGKHKVPAAMLAMMAFHHSLTMCLGIPMILHYRDVPALHWLCFELQFAAAVAIAVQLATKALDVSDRSQRRLFLQLSGFSFATMVVTRLIHWPVLVGQVFMVWYQNEAWITLAVAVPLCSFFTLFSWGFAIAPGWKRMVKFWNMPEEKVQPFTTTTSTTIQKRRRSSSVAAIQQAAASLVAHIDMELKVD